MKRPYRLLGALLLLTALPSLIASRGHAVTREVCPSDCQFSSINTAVLSSDPGDTVLVRDGTYVEHVGFPVGFSQITVRSVNGPAATIIDFKLTGGQTGGHVVQMGCGCGLCADCPTVLDGFTIRGGNSTSSAGGIQMSGGTVTNCIVEGNKGRSGGGIKLIGGDRVIIRNTKIRDNRARDGGGISITVGSGPTLIEMNTEITGNMATGGTGGGVLAGINTFTTTIKDTTISGNTAGNDAGAGRGGGLYILGQVGLENSPVSGNKAIGVSALGGGIYLAGILNLTDSSVTDNQAIGTGGLGGGVYCNGLLNIIGAGVTGNLASTDGNNIFPAPGGNCFVTPRADLSIVKSGPSEVDIGRDASFTLRVTNLGPNPATGVTVVDELPSELTFQAGLSSAVCNASGSTITCDIGDLDFQATRDITIVGKASRDAPGKTITNRATVTGTLFDHKPENDTSTHDVALLCAAPVGERKLIEPVKRFGRCGPLGPKTPNWGSFGFRPVLEADSGEKLDIECFAVVPGSLPLYGLFYTEPGKPRRRVGVCPFVTGCNEVTYVHSGDTNRDGRPDCFVRTRWISKDYGDNDNPNAWTGEASEDLLDWAESAFDATRNSLTKGSYQFEYAFGPPLSCPLREGSGDPSGALINQSVVDPPIGPETEAFFDDVADVLSTVPVDGAMGEDTSLRCDLDFDEDCDEMDVALFQELIGTCRGDPEFDPRADDDGDGCVDLEDEDFLFGDMDGDGELNEVDNCPYVSNSDQDDAVGSGVGDACRCGDVNGDGLTNVVDALMIARGEVPSEDPHFGKCDVDGDGECNTVDALMIARGEVGSAPEFQQCPTYLGR